MQDFTNRRGVTTHFAALAPGRMLLSAAALGSQLRMLGFRIVDVIEVPGVGDAPHNNMDVAGLFMNSSIRPADDAIGHLMLSPLVYVQVDGRLKVARVTKRFTCSSEHPVYDHLRYGELRDNLIDLGVDLAIAFGLIKQDTSGAGPNRVAERNGKQGVRARWR